MGRAVERLLLVVAVLAGPLVVAGRCILDPDGDDFEPVDTTQLMADIVLVTMDHVSAADVHLYDRRAAFLPAFDELASRGITIRHAFAAADAEPAAAVSLISGHVPATHQVLRFGERAHPQLATILDCFESREFATAAFTNLPLLDAGGLGRRLDAAVEDPAAGPEELARRASEWVDALPIDRPLCLWVHYGGGDAADPTGRTFDRLLGGVLAGLYAAKRFEPAFVVAAGTSTRERADLGVPLVVRLPLDEACGSERVGPCSTMDLAPTLYELFNMSQFIETAGRSLMAPPHKPLLTGFWFSGKAIVQWLEPRPGARPALGTGAASAAYVLVEGPWADQVRIHHRFQDPHAEQDVSGTPDGDKVRALLAGPLREFQTRLLEPRPSSVVVLDAAALALLERIGVDPAFVATAR